jgi:hypothetical protein
MDKITSIEYKDYSINIYADDNSSSPDEWGDDGLFLVGFHRDFTVKRYGITSDITQFLLSGEEDEDALSPSELNKAKELRMDYHIFPLSAYIHGGVSLSLSRKKYPFNDGFDSCYLGAVFVKKTEAKTRKQAEKMALNLVNIWNMYLNGEVYGYMISKEGGDAEFGECWGFYGHDCKESGLLENAEGKIDCDIAETLKKKQTKLKTYIKNSVPLNNRVL